MDKNGVCRLLGHTELVLVPKFDKYNEALLQRMRFQLLRHLSRQNSITPSHHLLPRLCSKRAGLLDRAVWERCPELQVICCLHEWDTLRIS